MRDDSRNEEKTNVEITTSETTEIQHQVPQENEASTLTSSSTPSTLIAPPQTDDDQNTEPRQRRFVFQKTLFAKDIKTTKILIPRKHAEAYFPPLLTTNNEEKTYKHETLWFVDSLSKVWKMKLEYNKSNYSYTLSSGWKTFVRCYNLKTGMVVKFYELIDNVGVGPGEEKHNKHYGIGFNTVPSKTIMLFGQECTYVYENNDPHVQDTTNEDIPNDVSIDN
ncbi:hypothetical protein Scep_010636 [Stephania cephalantha]|uniref:TF-B3 domain-containing protein n=1 Tax=Stephania cephalantha TaxID=152367 RepID=A0AAP0JXP8_9MAGN